MVPARIFNSDTELGRPIEQSFAKTDRFWSAERRDAALKAFRDAGAKWVFAGEVPPGADARGWKIAGETMRLRNEDSRFLYYKRLQ